MARNFPTVRTLFLVWCLVSPAFAVIPGLLGPLQALVALLPQLALLLIGAFGGMMGWQSWRQRARRYWPLLVTMVVLGGLGLWWLSDRRAPVLATPSPISDEQPPGDAGPEQWPAFRGLISGSGGGATPGAVQAGVPPRARWSHRCVADGVYLGSAVVVGERVLVGLSVVTSLKANGSIDCHALANGQLLWSCPTSHPVFCTPVVESGRVYCGEGLHENEDSRLFCLDLATGKTLWTLKTRGHVEASPTIHEGRLYVSAGGDGFYCLEASSGKVVWHRRCGHTDCSAALGHGRVFVGTAYGDDAVLALDAASGKPIWKQPQPLPCWGHPALSSDGKWLLAGLGNGTFGADDPRPAGAVVAFDPVSGQRRWQRKLPDSVNTSLVIVGQEVLVGCKDGRLYCLDLASGQPRWSSLCGKPVLGSPLVLADEIYQAGGDGRLYGLERSTGATKWTFIASDVACESTPFVAESALVMVGGRYLQCLTLSP